MLECSRASASAAARSPRSTCRRSTFPTSASIRCGAWHTSAPRRRRRAAAAGDAIEYGFDLLDCLLFGGPPSQRHQLVPHVSLHGLSRPAGSPAEYLVEFLGQLSHLDRRHSAILALWRCKRRSAFATQDPATRVYRAGPA